MTPGEQSFCSKLRNIALKSTCPCAKIAASLLKDQTARWASNICSKGYITDYAEVLICIVSMEWSLQFWIVILCLKRCGSQASKNYSWFQDQPGFKVLTTASHYWPLEVVNGILQLHRNSDITVAIHNVTVLHSHTSSSVHINDSAYSNSSATV
ncbi:hypothetical protein XELAEV_180077391mg, partial [Xenopus laevis]